jgi:hypothetical protein
VILLQGEPPSVHCFNQWHTVDDGTLEWQGVQVLNKSAGTEGWGPHTAVNISWLLKPSKTLFFTSVIHHTATDTLMFEQYYSGECGSANFTELPSNRSAVLEESAHASLNPSSEFPSFAAPEGAEPDHTILSSDAVGYFSTGGVMTYVGMTQGQGLRGFKGGAEAGPLVLFDANASVIDNAVTRDGSGGLFPLTMVLSPANHFTSSILGHRRSCSHAAWRRVDQKQGFPPPTLVPAVDFSRNDLASLDNITEVECAEACIASPMCNAYTYGSAGCTSRHCTVRCYLKSTTAGWTTGSPQRSGYFCKDDPSRTSLVAGVRPSPLLFPLSFSPPRVLYCMFLRMHETALHGHHHRIAGFRQLTYTVLPCHR